MKKYIVISPYSKTLRNGKKNPKNYPYWNELIESLMSEYDFIQIGQSNEIPLLNTIEFKKNLSFKELEELVTNKNCHCWLSVDNFFPHFCASIEVPGIVVWGVSDPKIFGYAMHDNVIKSRNYLRDNQFDIWESCSFNKEVFVPIHTITNKIKKFKHV